MECSRALITGGTGFLGTYLGRALVKDGVEVVSTFLPKTIVGPNRNVNEGGSNQRLQPLDVRDPTSVRKQIAECKPDVVYHLAAQAYVLPSWGDPVGTMETNFMGTLNVLEAIRISRPSAVLVFAGSGAEYGDATVFPTPEDSPLHPTSPYAASKAAADMLCYQYSRSFGVSTRRLRIFGTTGPGKSGDVCNDFAREIVVAKKGENSGQIHVGNLDAYRDITDVRDVVRAIQLVTESGAPGAAYNVGSGESRSVRDLLQRLMELASFHPASVVDPTRARKSDEARNQADVTLVRRLGWAPEVPFDTTLTDILNHWRGLVG